jgi:hypothetical protein
VEQWLKNPDFSFETWNNVQFSQTIQDPQGWSSLNTLNVFTATPQSVFKETTAPASGGASAKITTVQVLGAAIPNPYQPGNLDTAGLLAIGHIVTAPSPGIVYGYNYTWRPSILSFQSKYTPVGNDSAFVVVLLTKWNGSGRDTIAHGRYATGATTTAYSLNSISLTFNPSFTSVFPDSEQVFISSSVYDHDGAQLGSTFYIDDLQWSGWNSVDDISGVSNNVLVYPNPATNVINFNSSIDVSSIEVNDIAGRLIGTYATINNKAFVETLNYKPGIYVYNIYDRNKRIVSRGRFEVTK